MLSIVMCGRNDGYCGNFIRRIEQSLRSMPANVEVVFVEWNPPPDRPRLSTMFRGVNFISIMESPEGAYYADTPLRWGWELPDVGFFPEYRAKNAGIRRAKGDWILVTNPDIVLSPAMRERLKGEFDPACFYRANRHDLDLMGRVATIHEQENKPLHFNASGDFLLMACEAWFALRGYPEIPAGIHVDSLAVQHAHDFGLKQIVLPEPIYHQWHEPPPERVSFDWEKGMAWKNSERWGL